MIRKAVIAISLFSLSACAGSGDRYPSLEIRDVERVQGSFDPVDTGESALPTPVAAPSADTIRRLADLTASATAIHAEFERAVPKTSRVVSSANRSSVASDSWASAQVALSDLESIRSRAAVALADIESVYVDARLEAQQLDSITAARSEVLGLIAEEDAVLARLRGQSVR
ncbi:hypothetical protein [Altererythrobacter sp. ZODW24]|uniref:hypothetical protein n=1 Tax=Altererythrobacter sp. ZODW24 TaxID=2185142 RepID=UPI0013B37CE3|nr:hypothetical protein [Altererythrobacter sp. ZODW24]